MEIWVSKKARLGAIRASVTSGDDEEDGDNNECQAIGKSSGRIGLARW